jgi:tripartite-type tricarboxylate transporter receptor subunit TctC
MEMRFAKIAVAAIATTLAATLGANAFAQGAGRAAAWPAKPVTIVTGYQAGSGTDTVARFLAENLRERTGQAFIVENKLGGIGIVAAEHVAKSNPDGYTVLFTPNSTHGISPFLYKKLPFDPVKDFQPVTTVLSVGFLLLVNPQTVPVNTVQELTAFLKAQPGKYSYGAGNASVRIAGELYRQQANFDAVLVPYKGNPQALTDLMGGQIQFMFSDVSFGLPQTRSGRIKALAVTNATRNPSAPELPTMAEAGYPGFEALNAWMAFFYPAGAPKDIAQKFAELCNAIMTSPKGRELLTRLGAEPYPSTPDATAKMVEASLPRWEKLVKAAGIEPE